MRRGMNPRDTRRMMKRLGLTMEPMPDVQQVIFKTSNKEIVLEEAEVAVLNVKGQKMFQVAATKITERPLQESDQSESVKARIPDEDVKLVADQTGRSMEEARQALEESGGDLAKAILFLQSS